MTKAKKRTAKVWLIANRGVGWSCYPAPQKYTRREAWNMHDFNLMTPQERKEAGWYMTRATVIYPEPAPKRIAKR